MKYMKNVMLICFACHFVNPSGPVHLSCVAPACVSEFQFINGTKLLFILVKPMGKLSNITYDIVYYILGIAIIPIYVVSVMFSLL